MRCYTMSLFLGTQHCSGPDTPVADYSVMCHIPEKWKSQEPPLVNCYEDVTVTEKLCLTCSFLYVICWTHSSLQ